MLFPFWFCFALFPADIIFYSIVLKISRTLATISRKCKVSGYLQKFHGFWNFAKSFAHFPKFPKLEKSFMQFSIHWFIRLLSQAMAFIPAASTCILFVFSKDSRVQPHGGWVFQELWLLFNADMAFSHCTIRVEIFSRLTAEGQVSSPFFPIRSLRAAKKLLREDRSYSAGKQWPNSLAHGRITEEVEKRKINALVLVLITKKYSKYM